MYTIIVMGSQVCPVRNFSVVYDSNQLNLHADI